MIKLSSVSYLRNINKFIISQCQNSQILHISYFRAQMFKFIVTQIQGSAKLNIIFKYLEFVSFIMILSCNPTLTDYDYWFSNH